MNSNDVRCKICGIPQRPGVVAHIWELHRSDDRLKALESKKRSGALCDNGHIIRPVSDGRGSYACVCGEMFVSTADVLS